MLYANGHKTWAIAYCCSWLCLKEGESRMPAGDSGSKKRSNAKIVHHLFLKIQKETRRKGGPQKIWDTQLCLQWRYWYDYWDSSREIGAEKKEQNVESKRSKELVSMKRNQGQRWQGGDGRVIDEMADSL